MSQAQSFFFAGFFSVFIFFVIIFLYFFSAAGFQLICAIFNPLALFDITFLNGLFYNEQYDFYFLVNQLKSGTLTNSVVLFGFLYSFFEFSLCDFVNSFQFFLCSFKLPSFFFFACFFFFSSLFSLLLIPYLGLYGIFIFNLLTLFFFLVSLLLAMPDFFFFNSFYKIKIGEWMFLNSGYKLSFSFYIDALAISFMFLTVSIAFFVNIYAFSYFRYEPLVERLLILLNLFVISMVILVTAGNLVVLFLGWELIGLTSFFLINFWVTRVGTLKAAFKAFSFNKYSDFSLFVAILLMFFVTYDLDLVTIISQMTLYTHYTINFLFLDVCLVDAISFFLLGAAFVKSAQAGAHIWLPDSMEAPVPASALIHSATLVSAGVYLLLRFSKFVDLSTFAYIVVPLIGSFTAFIGGFISMLQSDVKRTLAYSTISHCGFLMVIGVFFSLEYSILYLYVHGFFKAAVFLCVGNVIRYSRNYQDFRRMGGYYKYLPFECFASFVCLANLGGLPFTYGFFIKHYLFVVFNFSHVVWALVWLNVFLASFTGIFYSSRLFYYVFFDFKKSKKVIYTTSLKSNLNSKFYTNTSVASVVSIIGIIIFAYATIFYLFYGYTSKLHLISDYNKSFDSTLRLNVFFTETAFLANFLSTIVNIFFFYIFVLFISWRHLFQGSQNYNNFFNITLFLFLFLFFFWCL